MLLSAVSVLVVAQSSSEIPEGLMNNPVLSNNQLNAQYTCYYYLCSNNRLPTFFDQCWIIREYIHQVTMFKTSEIV